MKKGVSISTPGTQIELVSSQVSLEGESQDVNTALGTFPDLFHNLFNVVTDS